ncbi:Putative homeobox protein NANOG2 [Lemmus lemmus]
MQSVLSQMQSDALNGRGQTYKKQKLQSVLSQMQSDALNGRGQTYKKQKLQSVLSQMQSDALNGRGQTYTNLRHHQMQELDKILNLCNTQLKTWSQDYRRKWEKNGKKMLANTSENLPMQSTQSQNSLTCISRICNGHSWNTQAWDNQAQIIPFHHHCRE